MGNLRVNSARVQLPSTATPPRSLSAIQSQKANCSPAREFAIGVSTSAADSQKSPIKSVCRGNGIASQGHELAEHGCESGSSAK
jgi:hypothetical protein